MNKTLNFNRLEKIPNKHLFLLLFALLFFCYSLSGVTNESYRYISITLLGLWMFVAFFTDFRSLLSLFKNKKTIALSLYLLFLFITALPKAGLIVASGYIGDAIIMFSPMLILSYYLKSKQYNVIRNLSLLTSIFWLFLVIKSIVFYMENPEAARILASDSRFYGTIFIGGGYGLAYGSTIFIIYLVDLLLNQAIKKRTYKIIFLLVIGILFFLVLETRSTLTILCLCIGLVFSYFLSQSNLKLPNKNKVGILTIKKIVIICLLIIGCLFFYLNTKQVGLWIIDYTSNKENIVFQRIKEIGIKIAFESSSGGGAEDLEIRLEAPKKSLTSFWESPLIGRGYEYGYSHTFSSNFIGNHGEWADLLGSMGMLGSVPFFLIFWYVFKEERKVMGNYIPPTYIILVLLLGLFNPFRTFQSLLPVMFFIPAFGILFYIKKENKMEDPVRD